MDIQKIRGAIDLMHKTGSDDSQYVLVPLRDLEEMVGAYERDLALQGWMRKIFEALKEAGDAERKVRGETEEN